MESLSMDLYHDGSGPVVFTDERTSGIGVGCATVVWQLLMVFLSRSGVPDKLLMYFLHDEGIGVGCAHGNHRKLSFSNC